MDKLIISVLVGDPVSETVLPGWLEGIAYIDAQGSVVHQAAKEVVKTVMRRGRTSDE